MDLSHWDLVDEFSIHEAACLASGVDPGLKVLSSEQRAKVDLIKKVMFDAHDSAIKHAVYYLGSLFDDELPHLDCQPVKSGDLQSIELKEEFDACLRREKPLGAFDSDWPSFTRRNLAAWLEEKGYKSSYVFERPNDLSQQGNSQEKPLTTNERNTLLTIIAALCDYSDIKYKERGAATQIEKMTDGIGASVTDDTIRGVLKKIPEALETRKK